MTEEEIRPIAENYVEEYCHCSDGEYTDGNLVCAGIGTALIVSRQLEKRIAELEAQIEKMRNCANCKNYNGNEGFCVLGSGYGYNCNLEKWEIKEK